METWVDSHAHIFSEEFGNEQDLIIQRAKAAGLARILVVCCTLEEAERALEFQKKEPMLDIAVGFHPNSLPMIFI